MSRKNKQETLLHDKISPKFAGYATRSLALQQISDHIEKHIGEIKGVIHEVIPSPVHVDIHVVNPSDAFPYFVLVTSGMSDKPMNVPKGIKEAKYAELVMILPNDWFTLTKDNTVDTATFEDENIYWPIRQLQWMTKLPFIVDTWIGFGHSLANPDGGKPYAPNVGFNNMLVSVPLALPNAQEFKALTVNKDKEIHFYTLIPIYSEELKYKQKTDAGVLIEKILDSGAPADILDVNRANTCKRKKFFWSDLISTHVFIPKLYSSKDIKKQIKRCFDKTFFSVLLLASIIISAFILWLIATLDSSQVIFGYLAQHYFFGYVAASINFFFLLFLVFAVDKDTSLMCSLWCVISYKLVLALAFSIFLLSFSNGHTSFDALDYLLVVSGFVVEVVTSWVFLLGALFLKRWFVGGDIRFVKTVVFVAVVFVPISSIIMVLSSPEILNSIVWRVSQPFLTPRILIEEMEEKPIAWKHIGSVPPLVIKHSKIALPLKNGEEYVLAERYYNASRSTGYDDVRQWLESKHHRFASWGGDYIIDGTIVYDVLAEEVFRLDEKSLFDKSNDTFFFLPLDNRWGMAGWNAGTYKEPNTQRVLIDRNFNSYSVYSNFDWRCFYGCSIRFLKKINEHEFMLSHGFGDGCGGFQNIFRLNTLSQSAEKVMTTFGGCGSRSDGELPETFLGFWQDKILVGKYEYFDPSQTSDQSSLSIVKNLTSCDYVGNCDVLIKQGNMPNNISQVKFNENNDPNNIYLIGDKSHVFNFTDQSIAPISSVPVFTKNEKQTESLLKKYDKVKLTQKTIKVKDVLGRSYESSSSITINLEPSYVTLLSGLDIKELLVKEYPELAEYERLSVSVNPQANTLQLKDGSIDIKIEAFESFTKNKQKFFSGKFNIISGDIFVAQQ